MTNPFDARTTLADLPTGAGRLDIGRALRDGWDAMLRNFGAWLLVLFALFGLFVVVVGACIAPGVVILAQADGFDPVGFALLLIGGLVALGVAVVVGPPLTWGTTQFALDTLDGRAEVATVFRPFTELGRTLPRMLAVLVLQLVVNAIGTLVSSVLQGALMVPSLFTEGVVQVLFTMAAYGFGMIVSMAWALTVGARIGFANQLVVERGLSPVDAITGSWRITRDAKLAVAIFQITVFVLILVGLGLCLVGTIPAMMLASGAHASAYRQLAPRPAA